MAASTVTLKRAILVGALFCINNALLVQTTTLSKTKSIREAPTVTVKQGTLVGATAKSLKGDEFAQFLGIPYAKPPVGELRFKAPEPAEPWTGERDATIDGNSALSFDIVSQKAGGSEDCLYLNVFTRNLPDGNSANPDLKPVMVYIHGGAFTMGSGNTLVSGPEVLMQKDNIVLVTFNYRIGLLGFLSLENDSLDVPGNAGLKDQVLALKWVRENIRSFGGDPDNVTIFGISAGGASVHFHYLSPASKGLFHKAIAMSGSALNPWTRGSRNAIEVAKVLGIDVDTEHEALVVLRALPAEQLLLAQLQIPDPFSDIRPFSPVVEHPNPTAFLTKEPREIIESGDFNQVPFMTGMVNVEGYIMGMLMGLPTGDELIESCVPREWGLNDTQTKEAAAKLHDQYMKDSEDGIFDLATDRFFVTGILEGVETQKKTSTQPIYLYENSMETKLGVFKVLYGYPNKPGVAHADDTMLLLNMKQFPRICEPGSPEELATDRLVNLLVNFAESGDPTPLEEEFGVKWTPVSASDHLDYLDFVDDLSVKVNPFADRMEFWKQLSEEYNN